MKRRTERLRGMRDVLPDEQHQRSWLTGRLRAFLEQAGYAPVNTPVLESSDLFEASFGQELWQNLYTFRLHHRDLCLRPEYTASICRLYLDHYQRQPLPLRFQYAGPVFRYEAPGRGRYRQHTQLGIELFGGHPAAADAEILQLACGLLRALSIPQFRLELGHIGIASRFINRLRLDEQAAHLLLSLMEKISRSEDGERIAQGRLEQLFPTDTTFGPYPYLSSPDAEAHNLPKHLITSLLSNLSIAFGDEDTRQEVIERFLWKMERGEMRQRILLGLEFLRALHAVSGAPSGGQSAPPAVFAALHELLARYQLDTESLRELERLVAIVEQSGVSSNQILLNLALGRGVSYYTGLVFEFHAQNGAGFDTQLCGGGRYDTLIRAVGGARDVRACGFALGVERLLPLVPQDEVPPFPTTEALVIPVSEQDIPYALRVASALRTYNLRAEVDVTGHGVSAGLHLAGRKKIRFALIVGSVEQEAGMIMARDLATGQEQSVDIASFILSLEQKG